MCTAIQRVDFAIFFLFLRGEYKSAIGIISDFEMFDLQKTNHGDHPIHRKSSRFALAKTLDLYFARPSPSTSVRGLGKLEWLFISVN